MDPLFLSLDQVTGALAAYIFLRINGFDLQAPEREFEKLVLSVAEGSAGKDRVSEFFRNHSRPA